MPNIALDVGGGLDQPVAQALMISLCVIMNEILADSTVE
jgi:hypothetical protein